MVKRIYSGTNHEPMACVLVLDFIESSALSNLMASISDGTVDLVGLIPPNYIAAIKMMYDEGWHNRV